jgi:hypothetical protein
MLKRLKAYLTKVFHRHTWRMISCKWSSALPYRVQDVQGKYEYYTLLEKTNEIYYCVICGERTKTAEDPYERAGFGNQVPDHYKRVTIQRTELIADGCNKSIRTTKTTS